MKTSGKASRVVESSFPDETSLVELRCRVRGVVQGVGFRPFAYRLAGRFGVLGWVGNDPGGVRLRLYATNERLQWFQKALVSEAPPGARVDGLETVDGVDGLWPPLPDERFVILPSDSSVPIETELPPDLAVCGDCLREMRDPSDRRYRYPFISCAHCGPRYSIIENIPYDRDQTTMRGFVMCQECRAEYEDPADRRFHAQPIACPHCGPSLSYHEGMENPVRHGEPALRGAVDCLRAGGIIAVKGVGGFHLMCDPGNDEAVAALRARKGREEKPFALMAPSRLAARRLCRFSPVEETVLTSVRAPIVLAVRQPDSVYRISDLVAPKNQLYGVMLPYSPLHHLIVDSWLGFLVATSGNLSEEPICIDNADAMRRLAGIADGFLMHNRPIARPLDDSVVRVMRNEPVILRRARGYAPGSAPAQSRLPSLLATGGQLKNTLAVTAGGRMFPSQHIGDLSTREARALFEEEASSLSRLYAVKPEAVACDLHPEYASTLWAERQGLPVVRVQHHRAHVLSCISDNKLSGSVLGVAWDGSGYGPDGVIWGGEWLQCAAGSSSWRRVACFREFLLPGGDAAIRRPALSALGLLWEAYGNRSFPGDTLGERLGIGEREMGILVKMLSRRLRTPATTSAGRLFDGVAALLGMETTISYEGQAAMRVEELAGRSADGGEYPFDCLTAARNGNPEIYPELVVDWIPMLRAILREIDRNVPRATVARRFHNTLARMIAVVARKRPDLPVVLTGGCFQNKLLYESTAALLEKEGIAVYGHRDIPPNDGGLSTGQLLAAAGLTPDNLPS